MIAFTIICLFLWSKNQIHFLTLKSNIMGKQRTREHIIEDLGFNYVERQILYAGFTHNRITQNDYGYDTLVYTFNERGEISSFIFHIQLKSTDHILLSKNKNSINKA